ncbi:E3 ubiquitin-protein ligase ARIH1-like isoform X3 [Varroa destructor]|uniref:RBR-type E3 ubiquitin transferase n=1 Tax=Varroa destructor TaxID=109461 RepID=A0A7M7JW63_VARDE|nr:E3 ubiquitin-protein ligase ARIH1-like isoform X3 [Varroa destructor]
MRKRPAGPGGPASSSGTSTVSRSQSLQDGRSSSDGCEMRWGVGGTDGAGSMHSEDDGIRDYATLSPEQIVLLMGETISEANGVLQLRSTAARLLLNHFHWEKVTLFEKFFDADGDLKKLFLEVEIPQANVSGNTVTVAPVLTGGAPHYECQICMCEAPAESMAGLECGHKFCASCWNMYLSTKVMDEGCQMITCPAVSCGVLVDDQTVIKLLIDPKVRIHYQKQITESFVQCNRLLRWCPSPGCVNAVKVNSSDVRPVRCNCGHLFCFGCGKEYHDPVNCDMLRCWHKKDESPLPFTVRSVMTIRRHPIGWQLTQKNAPSVLCQFRRTVDAITCYVEIRIAAWIFAGFVLARGNRMGQRGTTAIASTRRKAGKQETHRRSQELRFPVIYSILTDTTTTCSRSNSRVSCLKRCAVGAWMQALARGARSRRWNWISCQKLLMHSFAADRH